MIHWSLRRGSRWDTPEHDPDLALLTFAERTRHAGLRLPKRRADWLLGRVTAKAVVAKALAEAFPGDWALGAIEIASDHGKPYARLAPEVGSVAGFAPGERLPVSVSISHAEGHALCAATTTGRAGDATHRALGIDLGFLEPRSPAFVETFFTGHERREVRDTAPCERDVCANLIWCAKEAVLKVLGVGLTVDTRELTCLPEPGPTDEAYWPLAPADREWRPFVAVCRPSLVPGGETIRGLWRSFPGFVGALVSRAVPDLAARGEPPLRPDASRSASYPEA